MCSFGQWLKIGQFRPRNWHLPTWLRVDPLPPALAERRLDQHRVEAQPAGQLVELAPGAVRSVRGRPVLQVQRRYPQTATAARRAR